MISIRVRTENVFQGVISVIPGLIVVRERMTWAAQVIMIYMVY